MIDYHLERLLDPRNSTDDGPVARRLRFRFIDATKACFTSHAEQVGFAVIPEKSALTTRRRPACHFGSVPAAK